MAPIFIGKSPDLPESRSDLVKSCSVLHLRANSESSDTPISLIPYLFKFRLLSSYLLCSILFIPAYSFCPNLSYYHAIDNHVVPFPSCSCIMCSLNLMFVRLLPPELRSLFLLHLQISEHLLYLNPLYLSIQSNLIIYIPFIFLPLSLFTFHLVNSSLLLQSPSASV